jgi:hypothetical protein
MRVFLGSTYADLVEHRAAVIDGLQRLAVRVEAMELWVSDPKEPLSVCLERVADADVYLCIVAHRYGTITETGVSFTEHEYNYARELGKDCLVFFIADDVPVLPAHISTGEDARHLSDFKRRLGEAHVYSTFDSPRDLVGKVLRSVRQLMINQGVPGAENLDFEDLWREVGQAWLGVDPPDMRLDFDPTDTPTDLLDKLEAVLTGIDDFHAHIETSTQSLPTDFRNMVALNGDLECLETIPYYENPFENRDWEMITFFPNRTARGRILVEQLRIHALRDRILREGLTEDLHDQLEMARKALMGAVQAIAID